MAKVAKYSLAAALLQISNGDSAVDVAHSMGMIATTFNNRLPAIFRQGHVAKLRNEAIDEFNLEIARQRAEFLAGLGASRSQIHDATGHLLTPARYAELKDTIENFDITELDNRGRRNPERPRKEKAQGVQENIPGTSFHPESTAINELALMGNTLLVQFKSSEKIYQYNGISKEDYKNLVNSSSKGKALSQYLKSRQGSLSSTD